MSYFHRKISGAGLRAQLLRGGIGSLIIQASQGALAFSLAIVLARTMGPAEYGTYSYVIAIIMLIAMPAQLGVPQLIVRETAKNEVSRNWPRMKGLWRWGNEAVAIFSLFSMLVLIAILAVTSRSGGGLAIYLLLAAPLVPLIALSNVWAACLRGLRMVVKGQLSEGVVRPVTFLILISIAAGVISNGAPLAVSETIILHVISSIVALSVSWALLKKAKPNELNLYAKIEKDVRAWRKAVIPLALISGLQLVNGYADLIILGMFRDVDDVGVYRAVTQLSLLISFGLTAINQVLHPHFSKLHAEGHTHHLQKLVTISARIILSLASIPFLIFVFAGETAIKLLFGEAYVTGSVALMILCFGHMANAAFGSVGALLNMTGHEIDTMKGMFIALIVNVVLNFVLIPKWGMNGAAVATTASFFVWNYVLRYYVRKRLDIESSALG